MQIAYRRSRSLFSRRRNQATSGQTTDGGSRKGRGNNVVYPVIPSSVDNKYRSPVRVNSYTKQSSVDLSSERHRSNNGMAGGCAQSTWPAPHTIVLPTVGGGRPAVTRSADVVLCPVPPPTGSSTYYGRRYVARSKHEDLVQDRETQKHQQRLQIYALNKIMTELELSRFKRFCQKNGYGT